MPPASSPNSSAPPAEPGISFRTLGRLAELLVVVLLAFLLYDKFFHAPSVAPVPAPVVAKPEAAVLALGSAYAKAIVSAAADTFGTESAGPWKSTGALGQALHDEFDGRLAAAWKPVASELQARFGATSDAALDPAKDAALRTFLRDLQSGAKK